MTPTPPSIAFVSDTVWPYLKGGKEKRLFDISTRLVKDGFPVTIYTMKWWSGPDIVVEHGVTLQAISRLYPIYHGRRRSIKEGVLFGLACFRLISQKWDIVDVDHMPFFPLYSVKIVCLLKGTPMLATWHEVWGLKYWMKYMGKLGIISYILEKLSIYLPNKITTVSHVTGRRLQTELGYHGPLVVIPNGVDVEAISVITPSPIKTDIIYVGRLLSHKNVDTLVQAVALIHRHQPNVSCLVIGDGPEKSRLEKLANRLGLKKNIKFLGYVPNMLEVYSLIKSSKVFCLPSTREGFGIVAIESFACNTPVVTINVPENAAKDLINIGVNGYLSKLNRRSLAKQLNLAMTNSATLTPTLNLEEYDWKNVIYKIKHSYRK